MIFMARTLSHTLLSKAYRQHGPRLRDGLGYGGRRGAAAAAGAAFVNAGGAWRSVLTAAPRRTPLEENSETRLCCVQGEGDQPGQQGGQQGERGLTASSGAAPWFPSRMNRLCALAQGLLRVAVPPCSRPCSRACRRRCSSLLRAWQAARRPRSPSRRPARPQGTLRRRRGRAWRTAGCRWRALPRR